MRVSQHMLTVQAKCEGQPCSWIEELLLYAESEITIESRPVVVDDQDSRALHESGRAEGIVHTLPQRRLAEDMHPAAVQSSVESDLLLDLDVLGAGKRVMLVFPIVVQAHQYLPGFVLASLED